jgi:two-component system, NtrC family, response regulator GlrR
MILLVHSTGFDPTRVAETLAAYELEVRTLPLERNVPKPPPGARPEHVVALIPENDLTKSSQAVARLAAAIPEASLLVCCAPFLPQERQVLVDCGTAAVMTPRDWSLDAVAERVVGELALRGAIRVTRFGRIVGAARNMLEVFHRIDTLAPLDETILILGETGTGKELAAQELHRRSGRRGDLVAVNCAALTYELMESELFGHERGAFTGALAQRKGLLVSAGHGTVFLDEIGDLALPAQAKLLRVLEEKKVRAVGSDTSRSIEARIILATNCDLSDRSRFRQDLFERLRGFTITLPSLRERRADLPILAKQFVCEYNNDYPGERMLPDGIVDAMFRYDWPGNVRELRQAIRQAAAFAPNNHGPISALHILEVIQSQRAAKQSDHDGFAFDAANETWRDVHNRLRAAYFHAVLSSANGDREVAARIAGVSRSQFYEILKQITEQEKEDR